MGELVDVEIVMGVVAVTGIAAEEVVNDEAEVEVADAALLQTVTESGVPVLLALAEEVVGEVFVSWSLDGRRHLAVANRPEGGEKEAVF
jgi:hypothetical protein